MSDIERRYQEIFDHTPVALWEVDYSEAMACLAALRAQGASELAPYFDEHPEVVTELASKAQVLAVNQRALQLYGAPARQDLLGGLDRLFRIFHPGSSALLAKILLALAAGEPQFQAEAHAQPVRGEPLRVLLTVRRLAGTQPQERALVSILDISERKRMEDALQAASDELARSTHELEHFAYIASHDLQEPLRMISSYTQLLARRYAGNLDERADKYIHYVTEGARRMQRLISDLLELSRVGTRSKPLQSTDCNQVLAEVLRSMKTTLKESGAQVTHDALPTVLADDTQLARLFLSLISNGIKFRGEEVPHVHVSARESGAEWILSVRDNGIGIEEKYLDIIFLAFRRLHERDQYPGSGIGLTIAKKVAERHGGRIWVESQPGRGSTFHVALPGAHMMEKI